MSLQFIKIASFSDYQNFFNLNWNTIKNQLDTESSYTNQSINFGLKYLLPGQCLVCNKPSSFLVDTLFNKISLDASYDSTRFYFRERLVCCGSNQGIIHKGCSLNSRMRATVTLLRQLNMQDKNVYISEQITPLYEYMKKEFSRLVGSEYLPSIPLGSLDSKGTLSQDITQLTFQDSSFDCVVSCDVLEHLADTDYQKSLLESCRILKDNGKFIFTVPTVIHSEKHWTRAIKKDGRIIHLLSPEWHGNPTENDLSSLCYRHFGWQVLDDLLNAGFRQAVGNIYTSLQYGHLGLQVIFEATK